jgi:hypothetical protein
MVLVATLLSRRQVPVPLSLILSSVMIGVLHGIVTVAIPNGNVRLFINPIAVSTVNRMRFDPNLAEYFLVTLAMYAVFGLLFSVGNLMYND